MAGASWSVGEVLLNKFQVERVLGEGGMGVVVAARHLHLDERVAIKFLLPDALNNPTIVARFLQEARAAVRIKSEHVARVMDVGTLPTGEPYMVMEHLSGSDLSHHLEARGPLPLTEAIECMVQACEALAEAHTLGIIHRDLKPANLFLSRRGDGSPLVKVLDFGISKSTLAGPDAAGASLTQTSTSIGTPLYMSPEQMRSARQADARSDVWSLGATLHELLTGQPPFNGDSLTEVCAAILADEAPSLRATRPELPVELEAVVLRCLAKAPAQRFQNMGELALELAAFGPEHSQHLARRVAGIVGVSIPSLSMPPAAPVSLLPAAAGGPPMSIGPGVAPPTAVSGGARPVPDVARTAGAAQTVDVVTPAPVRGSWLVPSLAAVALAALGLAGWLLLHPSGLAAGGASQAAGLVVPPPTASAGEPKGEPARVVEIATPAVSGSTTPAVPTAVASSKRPGPPLATGPTTTTSPTSPTPPTPPTATATTTTTATRPTATKDPDIGY